MIPNNKKLLAPISLEALIVDKDGNKKKYKELDSNYANVTPNYDLLGPRYQQVLGDSMTQQIFETASNLDPGIHLHWALPDALTKGFQTKTIDIPSFEKYLVKLYPDLTKDDVNNIVKELNTNKFLDSSNKVTRRFDPGQINKDNTENEQSFTIGLSDTYSKYEQDIISYMQDCVSSGDIEYPAAPDCWYVLRIFTDYSSLNAPKISLRAWVVESNHVSKDEKDKDRTAIPAKDVSNTTFYPLYQGRKSDFENWTPDNSENYIDKTTAFGPGDPMFAAYYPNCKTVFGLYDPLLDPNTPNKEEKKGNYTYMLLGWYSKGEQDPLAGDVSGRLWASCMEELTWSLSQKNNDQPKELLCHGMIYNIPWNGREFSYNSGVPKEDPEIVWGNTSIEALSTLIASKLPDEKNVAKILEAFNYELLSELDYPDGIPKLEEKIHEKSFSPSNGGIEYVINYPSDKEDKSAPDTTKSFPGILGSDLDKLNSLVKNSEDIKRKINCLQWETYSAWYKYVNDRESPMPSLDIDKCEKIVDKIGSQIDNYNSQINSLANQIDELCAKIKNDLTKKLPGYKLEKINRNRFWQPNHPVLLFSGEGVSRSFRHGYDHQFSNDGKLRCRSTEYTVTGIKATPKDKSVTVTSNELLEFVEKFPQGKTPVPDEIKAILAETILLDTNQSKLIAVAAFKLAGVENPSQDDIEVLAKEIANTQTLVWNACLIKNVSVQELADAGGIVGTVPDKIGVKLWSQPWIPLYMEWSVNILKSDNLTPDFSNILDDWDLDDFDYEYSSDKMGSKDIQTKGSVIITPHAPYNMQNALQNYINKLDPKDPSIKELQDICDKLGNLDILSQTMSGFNNSLLMRKETLQFPVFDIHDEEGCQKLAQKVANIIGHMNNLSPLPDSDFNPIQACFVKLLELWIVDAFGQIKPIIDKDISTEILVSEEMTTAGEFFKNWATIKPRITQPTRLNFEWISADEKMITNSDPSTTPICGWILPNHLDNSLMIYNSSGEVQGEIKFVQTSDQKKDIKWFSAPNTKLQPADLTNEQLKGFVNGLLNFGDKAADAFQELLENIDETLWSIDPLGFRQNQSLSVLIGRPLALANVGFGLEFYGLPAYSQSFPDLEKYLQSGFNSHGFENVMFPVRMGDISQICDGLLGYFVKGAKDTYKLFYATPGVKKKDINSGYVNYDHTINLNYTKAYQQINLTLLLDPRAGVHLTSGILPTKYSEIPQDYISAALNKMYVIFGINPLINIPEKTNIPLPTMDKEFQWSWVTQSDIDVWKETSEIDKVDSKAVFPGKQYEINEGWLKLNKNKENKNGK